MALAMVRHMYGDHAAAMAHADRSMELAPFNAQSLVLHAHLLMSAGRNAEAVVAAERARKLDPLSVNAIMVVASTLSAAGQHTRAIEELNKALKMAAATGRCSVSARRDACPQRRHQGSHPGIRKGGGALDPTQPEIPRVPRICVRHRRQNTRVTAGPARTVGAPRSTVRLLLRNCTDPRCARRQGSHADGTRARISGARLRVREAGSCIRRSERSRPSRGIRN